MHKNQILLQYTDADGVLVTILKPRMSKDRRTWIPFKKYFISNIGHQAMLNGRKSCHSSMSKTLR